MTDKKMTRNNKLQELFRFLETEGPFDIVVDGLNVGMHPRLGLDLNMVISLFQYKYMTYFYYLGQQEIVSSSL